jgi:LmbE family N-acetylglucosaminyl deacetylase
MLCPTDLVLVTWADDGHPDHEAAGSAALAAASRTDAQCIEVPVWAWHWATPGDLRIPWERAWRIPLEKALLERKRIALQAYRSQIEPDPDPAHAGRTILSSAALQRYLRPYEIVFL